MQAVNRIGSGIKSSHFELIPFGNDAGDPVHEIVRTDASGEEPVFHVHWEYLDSNAMEPEIQVFMLRFLSYISPHCFNMCCSWIRLGDKDLEPNIIDNQTGHESKRRLFGDTM